jgi:hypothetical protein
MSTTAELVTARATAGARYVAAVTELLAARADLLAIERVLTNNRVAYGQGFPSFGPAPDVIALRHGTYLPNLADTFAADTSAAFATRLAAWPTPE